MRELLKSLTLEPMVTSHVCQLVTGNAQLGLDEDSCGYSYVFVVFRCINMYLCVLVEFVCIYVYQMCSVLGLCRFVLLYFCIYSNVSRCMQKVLKCILLYADVFVDI